MSRWIWSSVLLVLSIAGIGSAQDRKDPGQFPSFGQVDQGKIDKAVGDGIAYLKANNADHLKRFEVVHVPVQDCELVLWTYLHAGVRENSDEFQQLLKEMLGRKLEATYTVALQAMVLEELDRVKYQRRIWQCAQFLVDNQSPEGYWGYGTTSPFADHPPEVPTATSGPKTPTGAARDFGAEAAPRVKPPVRFKLKVEKKQDGTGRDNSNTQYAILGLRACHDAGIQLPAAVADKAIDWCRRSQSRESGVAKIKVFDTAPGEPRPKGTTVALLAEPQGWDYVDGSVAYGSMTAGSVGSLCLLLYMKDGDAGKVRSWQSDKNVLQGLAWLAKNFAPDINPGSTTKYISHSKEYVFYYLYAIERAGMLYGTERFGAHLWYPEGAKFLLESQGPDGSWKGEGLNERENTCFAILFLKRGTRPLKDVASLDRFYPR